jgi:hypothetical protein
MSPAAGVRQALPGVRLRVQRIAGPIADDLHDQSRSFHENLGGVIGQRRGRMCISRLGIWNERSRAIDRRT